LRWPVFLYLAYIFTPANIIKDPKTLKKTVIIVAASALVVLFSGFMSLWGQDWQNSFFRLKSVYFLNSFPFGENHNLVAEFLNIGAFFILVIKEFLKTKRTRRLADIAFLLAAIGIILTFSRTGWITLFLQTSVYVYFRLKHYPKEKMATAILIVFLVIVASPLLYKMSILQDKNSSSTENRVLLTEISIEAFKDKPLFGHGSGTFVGLVSDNTRFTAKYGAAVDSHGVIQKIAAENGIFGLLTWVFLLLFLVRFCLISIKKYYPRVSWVLPFALAALGGIFFQFFNTSYYKGKVWLPLILFMIAISFSEKKYGKKDKGSPYPSQSK
jgi:O-antigen ligase